MKQLFFSFAIFVALQANALQQFTSAAEIINTGVKFIECVFSDLNGKVRSVTIPANMLPSAVENGLKFDGSSIPGCTSITTSDMHLSLDLNACIIVPQDLRQHKTAMIVCDVCRSKSEAYEASPRHLLRKMEQQLDKKHQLTMLVGAEIEFYIITQAGLAKKQIHPIDEERYFEASSDDGIEHIKQDILNTLVEAGVAVTKIHHEVGPSQYEVVVAHNTPVCSADAVILAKHLIQSTLSKYKLCATFIPKPLQHENGSGMHIHYSLYAPHQKQPYAFFSPTSDNFYLSKTAQSFIAGNLAHLLEVTVLFNPTINSYKRLVPGYEAPIYLCWGSKNRSALIRIPMINDDEASAIRAEMRSPDPSCNPYLAFAAIMATGIAGLDTQLTLPNPVAGNLYKFTDTQIKKMGINALPHSLEDALNYLINSSFAENFLGKKLLEEFCNAKLNELSDFENKEGIHSKKLSITEWELGHQA